MASLCPQVNIRPLDCTTDSITVCLETGAAVSGVFNAAITQPGVAGTVVPGSRFQSYIQGALGAAPVLDSPIPTVSQRVIIDWVLISTGVIGVALAVSAPQFTIVNTDGVPATVYWGFSGSLPVVNGSVLIQDTSGIVIHGAVGERLRLQQVAAVGVLQSSLSFGGYLVQ